MVSKFSSLLAIATLAIASVNAQAPTTNLLDGQCVTTYDATIDYFPQKVNLTDDKASMFTIDYHNNYKVVNNKMTGNSYVLVQCGTPTPNVTNATEYYQIPITKAAAMETSVVPYLEMIGAAEYITLIADGSLVTSACFQKHLTSGNITELSSTNQTLQTQQISAVQVQFGDNPYSVAVTSSNTTVESDETFEPGVLGRSSWINYYAAFFNLEGVANNVSDAMISNYARLKAAAANYNPKPVVAWTTYDAPSQYNNNTASFILSSAAYKVGLTQDAGATILNASQSTFTKASDLLAAIANADIVIDETYLGSNMTDFLTNYQITDQTKFKFLTNKKVYREDGILTTSGGYDWFAAPVAMADALLEDMINAVNPGAPSSTYTRNWLRNIALNETIKYSSTDNCTWDESAPRSNLATAFNGDSFPLSSSSSSAAIALTPKNMLAVAVSLASLAYLA